MAEYLSYIKENDRSAFNCIIETIQLIVPYVKDLQPVLARESGRESYLDAIEKEARIPSWLLSPGILRFVAIVAMLHDPSPPTLIVIEEIENGLDPRSLSILADGIRIATDNGITQVIATTHSPHLLDMLDLSDIIMVERDQGGSPVFWHPSKDRTVVAWAESFTPGRLYTMSRFYRD